MKNTSIIPTQNWAGLFTLSIRFVIGWTYFSAFWRRLVLENKLDPEQVGYIGEKFNHFIPNALGIKPMIEFLVTNPDHLWYSMVAFTIIEGIVGLFLILGFFTRLMSIGVFMLAMGILLGSGWIGTTCLDEWQIGVLGIASGFTLFFSGSSYYSLDYYFMQKKFNFTKTNWFKWLGSGELQFAKIKPIILTGALLIFGLTLYTNQFFHGGVFGTLHNKSVKPKVEISDFTIGENEIKFQLYRVEGVDVYGSFLIGIDLLDADNNGIMALNQDELATLSTDVIKNIYIAKIKPGIHSLIIPLGSKADLTLPIDTTKLTKGKKYTLKLTDISGITWTAETIFK
ncbi:TQO small subunit DoxD [Flavobacterium tegetincola]|uniref:TQO small subunit DoxD n=1 Tax=Flavobacterium tegetincola TaxID=150172 RepID=UPI0004167677|nr:TQO small subunit DoxD [Flavobacterium tegetincola]